LRTTSNIYYKHKILASFYSYVSFWAAVFHIRNYSVIKSYITRIIRMQPPLQFAALGRLEPQRIFNWKKLILNVVVSKF